MLLIKDFIMEVVKALIFENAEKKKSKLCGLLQEGNRYFKERKIGKVRTFLRKLSRKL